jgi:hypothetical protein
MSRESIFLKFEGKFSFVRELEELILDNFSKPQGGSPHSFQLFAMTMFKSLCEAGMLKQAPRDVRTQGWIIFQDSKEDCHIPGASQEFAMT